MIGDGADVGARCELLRGARVWPGVTIPDNGVRFSSDIDRGVYLTGALSDPVLVRPGTYLARSGALAAPLLYRGDDHRQQPVVLGDDDRGAAGGVGHRIVAFGIADGTFGRRVVDDEHASRPQQADGRDDEVGQFNCGPSMRHQVVRAVGQAGQHVAGAPLISRVRPEDTAAPANDARAAMMVERFGIDGGQHTVGAHPGEQPQPTDARTGADLDHVRRVDRSCEECQQRTGGGAHRGRAEFFCTAAGRPRRRPR